MEKEYKLNISTAASSKKITALFNKINELKKFYSLKIKTAASGEKITTLFNKINKLKNRYHLEIDTLSSKKKITALFKKINKLKKFYSLKIKVSTSKKKITDLFKYIDNIKNKSKKISIDTSESHRKINDLLSRLKKLEEKYLLNIDVKQKGKTSLYERDNNRSIQETSTNTDKIYKETKKSNSSSTTDEIKLIEYKPQKTQEKKTEQSKGVFTRITSAVKKSKAYKESHKKYTKYVKASEKFTKTRDKFTKKKEELSTRIEYIKPILKPIKLAIDFENSLKNVKKEVDFSKPDSSGEEKEKSAKENFKLYSKEILKLTTVVPKSYEELNKIAIEASKLEGFKPSQLSSFTEKIVKASSSMHNVSKAYGINSDIDAYKIASAIALTAKKTDTKETSIEKTTVGIGESAKKFNFNQFEAVALSTTVLKKHKNVKDSTKIINDLLNGLSGIHDEPREKRLIFNKLMPGLSTDEYTAKIKNNPKRALSEFFVSLNKIKNTKKKTERVSEVFGKESAVAIIELASSFSGFRKNLDIANDEKEYQNVTTGISGDKNEDTSSKIKMMEQSFTRLGIVLGERLKPTINSLIDGVIIVTNKITAFTEKYPNLTKWLGIGALAISAIVVVLGAIGVVASAVGVAFSTFGMIFAALGVVVSPIGLAIGAVIAVIWYFKDELISMANSVTEGLASAWKKVKSWLPDSWFSDDKEDEATKEKREEKVKKRILEIKDMEKNVKNGRTLKSAILSNDKYKPMDISEITKFLESNNTNYKPNSTNNISSKISVPIAENLINSNRRISHNKIVAIGGESSKNSTTTTTNKNVTVNVHLSDGTRISDVEAEPVILATKTGVNESNLFDTA